MTRTSTLAVVACLAIASCAAPPTPVARAEKVKGDTIRSAAVIEARVASADAQVQAADAKVQSAATHPDNPPETTKALAGAHTDLTGAHTDLAVVPQETAKVQASATAAAAITGETATALKTAQADLDAERDHWLGHKTRVLLRWLIGGFLALGVLSVVLYVFNPLGIGGIIGAELVHFLPFANVFSWLQDFLVARFRTQASATATSPAK